MNAYTPFKLIASLMAALLLTVRLVAAPVTSPADDIVTITHAKGKTDVKKNPKKVVIFDFGTLETYQALGIPVVGVPNNPPAHLASYRADQYAKVGSVKGPDMAALKAMKPDLIIISGRLQNAYDSLSALAPTLQMSTESGDYWSSFERNVRAIASLHGKEKEADKQLAELRKKADSVRERSQNDPKKGLVVLYVNERFAPNGAKSRFGFPFDVLGVKAAFESPAGSGERKRGEGPKPPAIQEINPDYLFVINRQAGISGDKKELTSILTDDIRQTNAFKTNKVFGLSDGVWYLSGGGLLSVDLMIQEIGSQLYGMTF